MSTRELEGAVALVTGATRGIGRAVATQLADAGARLALCARSDASEELRDLSAEFFVCDVADREAVDRTVASVVERFGGLHILVNNAGISIDGLLLRTKPDQWQRVLDVNLTGAFNCCKAAAKHLLRARERGRIVNLSSVVGERGNAGQVAYATSKAGLLGMTRTLALEFAARGVTVNAVAPGFIETQMTDKALSGERRSALIEAIPAGRIGTPDDVAGAVRFLCGPAASYITGEVLRVNGGLYM